MRNENLLGVPLERLCLCTSRFEFCYLFSFYSYRKMVGIRTFFAHFDAAFDRFLRKVRPQGAPEQNVQQVTAR
jgi:hypothetical protein